MAALTWRNVDAPDFRGSLNGLAQSNQAFSQGLSGLSQALGNFDKAQNEGANQQVLLEALKFQDPEAYGQALASGQLTAGVDPKRLSSKTLESLGSRSTDLLSQATNAQRLKAATYGQDRTQQLDAAGDAARPAIAGLSAAYASADPVRIAAAEKEFGPALQNLQPEQIMALAKGNQSLEGGALSNDRNRFSNNVTQRDDAAQQAANELITNIQRGSASADDARALAESTEMPANVRALVNKGLAGTYGNLYGPLGPADASSASLPGTQGTKAGNPWDTAVGFTQTSKPISGMSVGEAVQHGKDVLIPQTKGRADLGLPPNLGSSAMGPFQITASTIEEIAPKVLGPDWKNASMTPETQDKLAKELFEQRKDRDLSKTWTSLPDKTPGAYKDKSWDEMRQIIAQGEVGTGLDPLPKGLTDRAQAEVGLRGAQNTGTTGAAVDLMKNFADTRSPTAVADELVGGDFKGSDRGEVVEQLTRIMRQGGVNAAQAGDIMRRNPARANWKDGLAAFFGNENITRNLGGDLRLNDAGVRADIASLADGSQLNTALSNKITTDLGNSLTAAQAKATESAAQLQAAINRAKTQPALTSQIPRYRAQAQQAQQSLNSILEAQQGGPEFQARRKEAPKKTPQGMEPSVTPQAATQAIRKKDLQFAVQEFNN